MATPASVDVDAWVDTGLGYQIALAGDTLVCRNARGRVLASVPPAVRSCEAAEQLRGVRDWLATHERTCHSTVEEWMLGAFPVPVAVLTEVWPDPAWRHVLRYAVVDAGESTGGPVGFLFAMDPARGVGLVDRDGESHWCPGPTVTIPHPVLLSDLTDFRAFAAELGITQHLPQVMRQVYPLPSPDPHAPPVGTPARAHAGGSYRTMRALVEHCQRHGLVTRGHTVSTRIWESGHLVEARVWLEAYDPYSPVQVGDLTWIDRHERPVPPANIGPVAYSEGIRMAAIVAAGATPPRDQESRTQETA